MWGSSILIYTGKGPKDLYRQLPSGKILDQRLSKGQAIFPLIRYKGAVQDT